MGSVEVASTAVKPRTKWLAVLLAPGILTELVRLAAWPTAYLLHKLKITSNQVTDMHTSNGEFVQIMTWNNDQENLSLLEWYEKYDTAHLSIEKNPPTSPNGRIANQDTIFYVVRTSDFSLKFQNHFPAIGKPARIQYFSNFRKELPSIDVSGFKIRNLSMI